MYLSVIICTYNPVLNTLTKVLQALKNQTLSYSDWELIVVDNNSSCDLVDHLDISWHRRAKIIRENQPGLSYARLRGVNSSTAELIVFVDDDNILCPDYLENVKLFSLKHPHVGSFGGRSIPVYETAPPYWFAEAGINLGCQDFGPELYISNYSSSNFKVDQYPSQAPIGTGMAITRKAFMSYLREVSSNPIRLNLGRKGKSLSSGEDNDIIITIIKNGYEIAYVPSLVVNHLIPRIRYSISYLKKMAFESNKTWVHVLSIHGINPWKKVPKWTYPIRATRSYLMYKPWQSPVSSIKWKAACGIFKGLSEQ